MEPDMGGRASTVFVRSSGDCPSPALRERVATPGSLPGGSRVRVYEALSVSSKWLKVALAVDAESAPRQPSPSHCLRNGSLPLPQCGRGACMLSSIGPIASPRILTLPRWRGREYRGDLA